MPALFRDVTGHPTAEGLTTPYAGLRDQLVRPTGERLGLADYFAGTLRSVVEVHVDGDHTTMVALWPWKGAVVASLETLFEDGSILETRLGLRPRSTGDRAVPGAGVHLQEFEGLPTPEVLAAHRRRSEQLSMGGAGSPVRIRSLKAWQAVCERMVATRLRQRLVVVMSPTLLPVPVLVAALLLEPQLGDHTIMVGMVGAFVTAGISWLLARKVANYLPIWNKPSAAELLGGQP